MAGRLPFVDAHIHLWDLNRIHYPWLQPPFTDDGPNGSVEPIATSYLLDDYLADAAAWNVLGLVHVEAGADSSAALHETQWLQATATQRGKPDAIIAFAALDDPGVEALLEAHAAHPNVRGIREIINWHPNPRLTYRPRDMTSDDDWARGFALLGKYGFSFDLQCYPTQMPAVAAMAVRHPGTSVIINHMGMPVPADPDGLGQWRSGMRALAALPQVTVKISGMGFAFRPWSRQQVAPLIRETIDCFGPGRCMFASDFPTDKLFGGFDQTLNAYERIVGDLSEDERRDMFGRNANRIYRLGLDL